MDLGEARSSRKKGIIIYFGQSRCPYCQKLLEVNFGQEDIADYTRRHFDVIPVNIWGIDELTDLDGNTLTEWEYALLKKSNFTPTLIFYTDGAEEALLLTGYHPPYTFKAALEYVADGHFRSEPFKAYLERGDNALTFSEGELNEEEFFSPPPHALDRSKLPGEAPLAVFSNRETATPVTSSTPNRCKNSQSSPSWGSLRRHNWTFMQTPRSSPLTGNPPQHDNGPTDWNSSTPPRSSSSTNRAKGSCA